MATLEPIPGDPRQQRRFQSIMERKLTLGIFKDQGQEAKPQTEHCQLPVKPLLPETKTFILD